MKPRIKNSQKPGFALVVTLTLMVLLSILALGLLSLSSVSLRSMGQDNSLTVARANARMAMLIAIGQLQKHAGPDQRVTATAEILNSASPNPQWAGSWKTGAGNETSQPVWLVSGTNPNPATQLTEANSALFASIPDSDASRKELRAELVEIKDAKYNGKYAYWIGDEGTRARVDISAPKTAASTSAERSARSQSPLEPKLTLFDETNGAAWQGLGSIDKQSLITMDTVGVAAGNGSDFSNKELAAHYFNDLTTGGFGLPVNVRNGGMKTDLSVAFDRSMDGNSSVLGHAIGGNPTAFNLGSATKTYDATGRVTDPDKFFLNKLIPYSASGGQTGPNWGSLYSYAKSWENVNIGSVRHVPPLPVVDTDMRQENWLPYKNSRGTGNHDFDSQHMNSVLHPVLSTVQMTFRIKVDRGGVGTAADPPVGQYWIPQLEIKPVIGLWNPYNVSIQSSQYYINWAIPPYLRLAQSKNGGPSDVHEMWLREYWKTGNEDATLSLPTENSQGGGYFNLITPSVTLAPGEMKMFSVGTSQPLAAARSANLMVESWGESGGFYMDIKRSQTAADGKQKTGDPLRVPSGYDVHFGTIALQDTQNDGKGREYGTGTKAHFNSALGSASTSTWISLKAGNQTENLQRYANFWNGGRDDKMAVSTATGFIPEHVRHSRYTEGLPSAKKFRIDTLAAGDVGHLATWRFNTRTTTGNQSGFKGGEENLGLRGWIDTNPRPSAVSLRFDGSKVIDSGFEGWATVSNFMAEDNPDPSIMGDEKGGARGLVGEGKVIDHVEPPATIGFQGFGGPSNNSTEGVANVILYDVPRSPLVSVGQFQHASLGRYQFEPGYIVGNSYASMRIPTSQTFKDDFAGISGFKMTDISYEVNKSIWDSVFFSTLAPDYMEKSGQSFDNAIGFNALVTGSVQLPNPRMVFAPQSEDTSLDGIIAEAGPLGPEAIASRILIKGAFNVNSTSKEAWKAILSTMGNSEMPVISLADGSATWTNPDGIRFNRFSYTASKDPYQDSSANDTAFWLGWRKLSAKQLDDLAQEIVNEVRKRGPFRSFAEFVNRNPNGSTEQQTKGALQAALDRIANNTLPVSLGKNAAKPRGTQFNQPAAGEKQSAGYPGYILQGDILQSLAPILQVRSDYFRIRAYGESTDNKGNVTKAWCEAYVQRYPDYIEGSDNPEVSFDALTSNMNKEFGRNFRVTSFRWLSPTEI